MSHGVLLHRIFRKCFQPYQFCLEINLQMDHRRVHAMSGGQLRYRALALSGFQRHTSLEARVWFLCFLILISSACKNGPDGRPLTCRRRLISIIILFRRLLRRYRHPFLGAGCAIALGPAAHLLPATSVGGLCLVGCLPRLARSSRTRKAHRQKAGRAGTTGRDRDL